MKNFLLSLRFVIKRVFRLTGANIAWLIVTALIVAIGTESMGVEPVARGDYDYQFYLMMLPYLLVFCLSDYRRPIRTFMQAFISVQAGFTSA